MIRTGRCGRFESGERLLGGVEFGGRVKATVLKVGPIDLFTGFVRCWGANSAGNRAMSVWGPLRSRSDCQPPGICNNCHLQLETSRCLNERLAEVRERRHGWISAANVLMTYADDPTLSDGC